MGFDSFPSGISSATWGIHRIHRACRKHQSLYLSLHCFLSLLCFNRREHSFSVKHVSSMTQSWSPTLVLENWSDDAHHVPWTSSYYAYELWMYWWCPLGTASLLQSRSQSAQTIVSCALPSFIAYSATPIRMVWNPKYLFGVKCGIIMHRCNPQRMSSNI